MQRSYLFAPGHKSELLAKVFMAGADVVVLDLEDAVPLPAKESARALVAKVLDTRPAYVRVNAPRTRECAADLDAVAGSAAGIRIPKTESPLDVQWVAERVPGTPLVCAIETARGVLAAQETACVASVRQLAIGGVDLRRDLASGRGELATLYARSHLVLASRAAGIEPPVDSVFPYLDDEEGLRQETLLAQSLGYFGKSAIHPRQLSVIHDVFTPSPEELRWAQAVVAAFEQSEGSAARLEDGEFVALPVADRARRLLQLAARIADQ